MKFSCNYFHAFFLITFLFSFAKADVVFTLDFETAGGYTTSIDEYSDGAYDYFIRTNGADISANVEFSNIDGYFFAAQDINGNNTTAPCTLFVNEIDIGKYNNLKLFIDIAEDDATDGLENWDAGDYLLLKYSIDSNLNYNNLLSIQSSAGGSNHVPSVDRNFDDIGDSTEFITSSFQTINSEIINNGNVLSIIVIFNLIYGESDIAIDNIIITGDTVETYVQPKIFFNEIRADDEGTDDAEFVELIGEAGTDISGCKIIHYNGADAGDGAVWSYEITDFIIPNDGIYDAKENALGFFVLGCSGFAGSDIDATISSALQNGPDGLVLYDVNGNILDAVAWGGQGDIGIDDPDSVFTDISTSANNYLHLIGNDAASDNSLQAPNNVQSDDGSGWTLNVATPGALNVSQSNNDI